MMPARTHDEECEQAFVVDLKGFIGSDIEPLCREMTKLISLPDDEGSAAEGLEHHVRMRRELESQPIYQAWLNLSKTAQDMMWDSIATPVDRQIDELVERADIKAPKGSLTLDPAFEPPSHITAQDIHRMPGNYCGEFREGDIRQGALYDCGGYIYNMGGKNGGHLNDTRGHTVVSHYFSRSPNAKPKRVLEMGCSAGNSTVAIASYFPDSEVHAIDVGAGLVRYAYARSELMGQGVHFSQQNAADTNFEDSSFDLIVSCVMLHETSKTMMADILAECHRLLRPGGMMIHLEVPAKYEDLDTWSRIRGDYEAQVNYEPFWRGAISTDYQKLAETANFQEIVTGYQDATRNVDKAGSGVFRQESLGVHRSWFVLSAVKASDD